MLRHARFLVLSSLLLLPASFSQQSTEDKELPEMVVTATKTERPIREVGSSVTVIGRSEIERSGKVEISELLKTVPGLTVSGSRATATITSVLLRGAESRHTLVFLDGVPLNDPNFGGVDFSSLELVDVESIEVLRGPQSTLYGSSAIGGVISITTRKGKGAPSGQVRAEYGSFNTHRETLHVAGGSDVGDFSIGVANTMSGGTNIAEESRNRDVAGLTYRDWATPVAFLAEEDEYESRTVSARVGFNFLDDGRMDFSIRGLEASQDMDSTPVNPADMFATYDFQVDDPTTRREQSSRMLACTASKTLVERWKPSLRFALQRDKAEWFSALDPSSQTQREVQVFNAELQNDVTVTETDVATFGVEYESESGQIPGNFDKSISAFGLYFQNQIDLFESLHLTAGVRYDRHSTAGDKTTYRFTGAYLIEPSGTRLHGTVGTGFRAPTLNGLFYLDPWGYGAGNPALKPEESLGFDAGIEQQWLEGRFTADVTYFRNEFEELIDWANVGGTWMPENVSKAEAEGLEVALKAKVLDNLTLQSTYTYQDTADKQNDRQLRRRPKHSASLQAAYSPLEELALNLRVLVVRDRIDTTSGVVTDMDNYVTVDLNAVYKVLDQLEAHLRIDNLLDGDFEDTIGFQSPGIAVYGGLTWKF